LWLAQHPGNSRSAQPIDPALQVSDNPQEAATRAFLSHFHRTGALPPATTAS